MKITKFTHYSESEMNWHFRDSNNDSNPIIKDIYLNVPSSMESFQSLTPFLFFRYCFRSLNHRLESGECGIGYMHRS